MSAATHVAVIGGGYAGLAAAVELAHRHVPVTLFEAAKQLGGRARHVELNGCRVDNGQHILIGAYQETLRLLHRVGVDHRRALLRLPLELDLPGQFHLKAAPMPAPLHLAWALLSAQGLRWRERLGAVRFVHRMRQRNFRLAADQSVESLLRQHEQGRQAVQCLWEPLCVAALNTPPASASAQVFLHVLRDSLNGSRAASDLLLPRVDLSALFPEPAADFISRHGGSVRLATPVRTVRAGTQGFTLQTDAGELVCSHVVSAVPPSRLGELAAGLPALAPAVGLAQRLNYQPICTVYLQYPATTQLARPMLGFGGGLAQWAFDRGHLDGHAGLVAVVISAEGRHTALTPEQLAAAVHAELAQALGPLPPPLWHRVIREKRATFACTVGLQRPGQVTDLPNFYLAGDYTASDYPATLEAAVRSGVKCAQRILEQP